MKLLSSFVIFFLLVAAIPVPLSAVNSKDIPIIPCPLNRTDKRTSEVAICAVFRDEGPYIKEWVEFHRLVGVKHFFLYNNCSQDCYWEVLKPYVDSGIVELFDVPFDSYAYNDGATTHNVVQVSCYNHALKLAAYDNYWLAIIDLDEFICPVIDKDLPTALGRYKAMGVMVYWQIYGTSNVADLAPGELLVEKLLLKEPNVGGNGMFKSIVRPKYAVCIDPHYSKVKAGFAVLPNNQKFTHTPKFASLPVDIIRINHYSYRTDSYYYTNKKPRKARWGYNPSPELEQSFLNHANSVYDPVMMRFVPELRQRMFGQ